MKKIITCMLATILIFSSISVSAKAEENIIKVSLDNIEEIMLEYSPDLKIADNNLEKAREAYDDIKDRIDDLEHDKDKLEEQIKNESGKDNTEKRIDGSTDSGDGKDKTEALKDQLSLVKKELSDLEKSKDKAKYSLKTARIQYDQKVKLSVSTAQQQYVKYLDTLAKRQIKESDVNSKKKENDTNKIKYDMGFISKKEYNSHGIDTVEVDNGLEELINSEETSLKELKNTLGLSLNKKIIVNNDINFDLDKISNINFKNDVDKMLDNSKAIEVRKIELDEAEDISDSDYDVDNAEIYLKQEKNNAKLDFERQYNALMASYNSIKTSKDKLQQKQSDFDIMQTKHNYGFVSRKQTEDLENELNKQTSDFLFNKNNLYINYLHYIQMKDGYSYMQSNSGI